MKYSKQREMIYNELLKNPVHPTAETIYQTAEGSSSEISGKYLRTQLLSERNTRRENLFTIYII